MYFRTLHADTVHKIEQGKSNKQYRALSTNIMKTLIVFHKIYLYQLSQISETSMLKRYLFCFNVNCVLFLYC